MDTRRVMLACTLSAAVWTTVIACLGYIVGDNWPTVGVYLAAYGRVIIGLAIAFLVYYVVRRFLRRKRALEQNQSS